MLNNQQLVQEINAQRTTIEDKFEEVRTTTIGRYGEWQ